MVLGGKKQSKSKPRGSWLDGETGAHKAVGVRRHGRRLGKWLAQGLAKLVHDFNC